MDAPAAHLWCVDLREPEVVDLATEWETWLSETERCRLDRLVNPGRRRQSVLGHGLARIALSWQEPDVPARCWELSWRPHGAPRAQLAGRTAGVEISIAHGGKLIACLVCNAGPCGVDVEPVDPGVDVDAVAALLLTKPERRRLAELPDERRPEELLRYWTVKEAFGKALGIGLTELVKAHDFSLDGPVITAQAPDVQGASHPWAFGQWTARTGELLAVALPGDGDGWLPRSGGHPRSAVPAVPMVSWSRIGRRCRFD
jgi:4'-phosphopantetheinyl transferase